MCVRRLREIKTMNNAPWSYLEKEAAADAPPCDNPSGLYCPDCRASGCSHCAHPEWCGGMRRMAPHPDTAQT